MQKVVVFGNSGSGKSTLAQALANKLGLAHLDLDTVAWAATTPVQRKALQASINEIQSFIQQNKTWVIEGCYSDLLEVVCKQADTLYFMNLPTALCIENAKNRPWEPHKYESKEAQDANLAMLIDWIGQYQERLDTFSQRAHQQLYNDFTGSKTMFTENQKL